MPLIQPGGRFEQLFSAFMYGASSVLILLVNKRLLSSYKFKFSCLMTLFHMAFGVVCLVLMRKAKMVNYAPFDWTLARRAAPLSLCFVANVVVGMVALDHVDIPMFATLRRLTVLFVLLNEWFMLGKRPQPTIVGAVTIMIVGSLIGGYGDLKFDLVGYMFVLLNNLFTALNLVVMKKTIGDTKLAGDQMSIMYYNSLISIPFLLVAACVNGEMTQVWSFPHLYDTGFQMAFLISGVTSFVMNYSTFWCTRVNSALTTSVTGQVKNVLSSFVSIAFQGVSATPTLLTGLTVGLSGSMVYGYQTFMANQKNRAKQAAEKAAAIEEGEAKPAVELRQINGKENAGIRSPLLNGSVPSESSSDESSRRDL